MPHSADEIASAPAQRALWVRAAQVFRSRRKLVTGAGRDFLVNAAECEPMLKVDQQLMAAGRGKVCSRRSTR